jgi:hypothetical protein
MAFFIQRSKTSGIRLPSNAYNCLQLETVLELIFEKKGK